MILGVEDTYFSNMNDLEVDLPLIWIVGKLFVILCFCATVITSSDTLELEDTFTCSLHMSISTIPNAGRGIFAGRDFKGPLEVIDRDPTLVVYYRDCHDNQMEDYLFLTEDPEYTILAFGSAVIYNSNKLNKSVDYAPDQRQARHKPSTRMALEETTRPFTNYTDMVLFTARAIQAGEELFEYYGDIWHEARGFVFAASPLNTGEIIVESDSVTVANTKITLPTTDTFSSGMYHKVCLSNVYVNESLVFEAGRGLYASRAFEEGELVIVSPMLALSRKFIDSTSYRSFLKNYCFSNGKSDIVLAPLTKVAMINHQPPPEDNLEMRWFSWTNDSDPIEQNWKYSVDELLSSRSVLLDVGFHAKRRIEKDEELFIDYGLDWELAWTSAACHMYDQRGCKSITSFRSYISVPEKFFPIHWDL